MTPQAKLVEQPTPGRVEALQHEAERRVVRQSAEPKDQRVSATISARHRLVELRLVAPVVGAGSSIGRVAPWWESPSRPCALAVTAHGSRPCTVTEDPAPLGGGSDDAAAQDHASWGVMARRAGISTQSINEALKLSAVMAIAIFAIGFVCVNSYLFTLGASDFSLARPRFVATGVLFIASSTVAALPAMAVEEMRGRKLSRSDRLVVLAISFVSSLVPLGAALLAAGNPWPESLSAGFAMPILCSLGLSMIVLFFDNPTKAPLTSC